MIDLIDVTKTFDVLLDIKTPTTNREFEVVEGDTGNILEITLVDNGQPVDMTGCLVLAIFSNSKGTAQQDNNGHGIVTDGNKLTVELYTGSFSPGLVECEIEIFSGENIATLVTSAKFNFNCRRSIMNEDTVLATDEYPILVDLIQRVEGFEDAEAERVEAEAERIEAEAERVALHEKWEGISAEAETLQPGDPASAALVETADDISFLFGIPPGPRGPSGVYVGTGPMPDDCNVQIDPEGDADGDAEGFVFQKIFPFVLPVDGWEAVGDFQIVTIAIPEMLAYYDGFLIDIDRTSPELIADYEEVLGSIKRVTSADGSIMVYATAIPELSVPMRVKVR